MRRVLWLLIAAVAGLALLYISRFWPFELWDRPGLFGLRELRPQGGLLQVWLRGTPFAAYEALIWITGAFLGLTGLQRVFDRATR